MVAEGGMLGYHFHNHTSDRLLFLCFKFFANVFLIFANLLFPNHLPMLPSIQVIEGFTVEKWIISTSQRYLSSQDWKFLFFSIPPPFVELNDVVFSLTANSMYKIKIYILLKEIWIGFILCTVIFRISFHYKGVPLTPLIFSLLKWSHFIHFHLVFCFSASMLHIDAPVCSLVQWGEGMLVLICQQLKSFMLLLL